MIQNRACWLKMLENTGESSRMHNIRHNSYTMSCWKERQYSAVSLQDEGTSSGYGFVLKVRTVDQIVLKIENAKWWTYRCSFARFAETEKEAISKQDRDKLQCSGSAQATTACTTTSILTPHWPHRAVALRYWQSDNRASAAFLDPLRVAHEGNVAWSHSCRSQAVRQSEGPATYWHLHRAEFPSDEREEETVNAWIQSETVLDNKKKKNTSISKLVLDGK